MRMPSLAAPQFHRVEAGVVCEHSGQVHTRSQRADPPVEGTVPVWTHRLLAGRVTLGEEPVGAADELQAEHPVVIRERL